VHTVAAAILKAMRLPTFALLIAGGTLLLSACSDSGNGGAVVVISTPPATNPNLALSSTPTPTATPVPPPEIVLSTQRIYQAGTVLVSVVGELQAGTATFLGRTFPLTQGTKSMYAFVPAGADDVTGDHPLEVDFTLKNGSKGTLTSVISVLKTNWTVDAVTVADDLTGLLDPAVGDAEAAQLAKVYGAVTPRKLWDGPWQLPDPGAITTRFGEQRSYNGSPPSGHHGGTDIGAEAGTPVVATNSGTVVLARQLQLRGNMVVIDHGGGLFSGYGHLRSFAVAQGQQVKAGDVIGYVGTTGLSTGPHLHWEMSVGGVLVDAQRFVDGSNGF
jgi:murein DD-endopeptidase MepM/ murein hydrolase activator NlpD